MNFARNLHIETRVLEGEDAAATLVDFARRNEITQIFLVRPPERRRFPLLSRNLIQKIVSLARDMQVVIYPSANTRSPSEAARHSSAFHVILNAHLAVQAAMPAEQFTLRRFK